MGTLLKLGSSEEFFRFPKFPKDWCETLSQGRNSPRLGSKVQTTSRYSYKVNTRFTNFEKSFFRDQTSLLLRHSEVLTLEFPRCLTTDPGNFQGAAELSNKISESVDMKNKIRQTSPVFEIAVPKKSRLLIQSLVAINY